MMRAVGIGLLVTWHKGKDKLMNVRDDSDEVDTVKENNRFHLRC